MEHKVSRIFQYWIVKFLLIPRISNESFFFFVLLLISTHEILNISEWRIFKFNYALWFMHTQYNVHLWVQLAMSVQVWHQTGNWKISYSDHRSALNRFFRSHKHSINFECESRILKFNYAPLCWLIRFHYKIDL